MKEAFANFFTKHRGWVIFLVALPISFVYQQIQDFRNWFYRTFLATNKLHDRKVKEIQELVIEAGKTGKKMCTARKPWMTMSIRTATFKKDMVQIPIGLKNILSLDTKSEFVRVEPMVTMGDLTHYLIPKGYALAVQVEMDDLTVGGLCMGVGIETTSHRYGFLFESIQAYEIITADGSLVRASATENPDLFHALPWSHGTLGFLVAVELKVIQVKPYMQLKYTPYTTQESFCAAFRKLAESDNPPSFLEALAFSKDSGVIMTGEFADINSSNKNLKINPINRWYKQWFYKHVESFLEQGASEELIPLRHYFHRHTPSVFFQLKDLIPFANNPWYRYLFAWLGAPKVSLIKLTMNKKLRRKAFQNRVAQDIVIPIGDMADGLDFVDPRYGIYPMWVCPVKLRNHGQYEGFLHNPKDVLPGKDYQMFVDLGIYGIPPMIAQGVKWDSIATSRELEDFTTKKGGHHLLYADIFMTKPEFEAMFNHGLYREMRQKFKATDSFPEVYQKVVPEKWLINLDEFETEDKVLEEEKVQV